MKKLIIIIVLALALTGCTTTSKPTTAQLHPELYRKAIILWVTQARQQQGAQMDAEARRQARQEAK